MFKWLMDWGEEVKNRFVAVVPGYFGGGWFTSGYLTDPTTGTILADTGPLAAGIYNFTFMVTATATFSITRSRIEHRNQANTTTLVDNRLGTLSDRHVPWTFNGYKIKDGERIRWIIIADFTGSMQATIVCTRVFPLVRGQ